jgi:hypothetical protein
VRAKPLHRHEKAWKPRSKTVSKVAGKIPDLQVEADLEGRGGVLGGRGAGGADWTGCFDGSAADFPVPASAIERTGVE